MVREFYVEHDVESPNTDMSEESDTEKPFEATPRKLEQARKRGEGPVSQELVTCGVYVAFALVALLLSPWSLVGIGSSLTAYIAMPNQLNDSMDAPIERSLHYHLFTDLSLYAACWLVIPFTMALVVTLLQVAVSLPWNRVVPKINRISPLKNAKEKFGAHGLFAFAKSTFKLLIYSLILFLVMFWEMGAVYELLNMNVYEQLRYIFGMCTQFIFLSICGMSFLSLIDVIWQRRQFARRQRMSLVEIKDEIKEHEGDANTNQTRRRRALEIASDQMISDVRTSDVVIVNPTHYAVALCWDKHNDSAPRCVAKGMDEVAKTIRGVAIEHDIPIFRDPLTARAIFRSVRVGSEIATEHYKAVAAAIRFSLSMKKKMSRSSE